MNLWPPFRAGGVRVREISPDFRHVRVELVRRWFGLNANYVGTHFGGNLFAMTDPFYMLMYLHNLGDEYMVWDTNEIDNQQTFSLSLSVRGKASARRCSTAYI